MNGYQRPGYSTVSASDSHVLQLVSTCPPLAAQFLAVEDRHNAAVVRAAQIHWRREARAASGSEATAPAWLRQIVGSALVHLGRRLGGASTAAAAIGTGG